MSTAPVPDEVKRFLTQYVRSIAQLEILLLVSDSPDRWWIAKEIYKILLSNEALVEKSLAEFTKNGLMRKSDAGAYQFSPTDETRGLVKLSAEIYRERPARIAQLIYETPLSEIEEFAKAFRIRKEP